mgnify:CR=1 FL=1
MAVENIKASQQPEEQDSVDQQSNEQALPAETPEAIKQERGYFNTDIWSLTQKTDIPGLSYDFNYGARVGIPEGDYRVRILDKDMGVVLYNSKVSNATVTSSKKFYVNFRLEVYKEDKLVFEHDFDAKGKKVLIKFPEKTLGDRLAWFPYAEVFREKHDCDMYCTMNKEMSELLAPAYPKIKFVDINEQPEDLYATYYTGIFFPCDDRVHQPGDFRIIGLQKNIPYILGLKPVELRSVLLPKNKERIIKEPYVCIAAQATTQAKYWNNPSGWMEVVKCLKSKGYRVLCIDRDASYGNGSRWNSIPYGAEDYTGHLPLQERVDLLYHADFFVGLSSGLSWLAWGVGKPVVMISGLTLPHNEFYTPYRAINYHVCNGCWNDTNIEFVHTEFDWCPRHKNTDNQFECTRFITAEQVTQLIDKLMRDYGFM